MNKIRMLCILFTFIFTLSGCTNANLQVNTDINDTSATQAASTVPAASNEVKVVQDIFTARDFNTDYNNVIPIILDNNNSVCASDAVSITDNAIFIKDEGCFELSGELKDGNIIISANSNAKIQLVLNNVSINSSETPAIYIDSADKVFVTTAENSENYLTSDISDCKNVSVDAVVFSHSDIVFNGKGVLTIYSDTAHGVVSKDDLKITSGTYIIDSARKALSGKDSVSIAGGDITLKSGTDAIHSENTNDDTKGNVTIIGGNINITAGDDGIHASNNLDISGGNITIDKSYEGLEAFNINISGGDIYIIASDDGINAASGSNNGEALSGDFPGRFGQQNFFDDSNGAELIISGGRLFVDAEGDGLDSNGSLLISGGEVYISGSSAPGNGALDYNLSGLITGGTVFAVGTAGMDQNFDASSTQCSLKVSLSGNAGDTITLSDSNGVQLACYAPPKQFSSVVISCPSLSIGASYLVSVGEHSVDVEFTDTIYSDKNDYAMGEHGFMRGERPELPNNEGSGFVRGDRAEIPDNDDFDFGGRSDRPYEFF